MSYNDELDWDEETDDLPINFEYGKIVEEIIPENGEKFRYVVGTDAKYLIDAIYSCRDDKKCMDDVINNIMGQYLS